jgi:hypothetical protein
VRVNLSSSLSSGTSVQRDWRAWLPAEKANAFFSFAKSLENSYTMLSVSLNEAIGLRDAGRTVMSLEALCIAPTLCHRFAHALEATLRALGEHAKHYGTMPNAAPLDPANFQGAKPQRTAKMNDLMSRVLLSQRSQFLYKISTLEEMVGDLDKEFRQTAEDLARGASSASMTMWHAVDAGHYDLNTCLRETVILLKSFLMALPEDQLGEFQTAVTAQMAASETGISFPQPSRRDGRMSPIARE